VELPRKFTHQSNRSARKPAAVRTAIAFSTASVATKKSTSWVTTGSAAQWLTATPSVAHHEDAGAFQAVHEAHHVIRAARRLPIENCFAVMPESCHRT